MHRYDGHDDQSWYICIAESFNCVSNSRSKESIGWDPYSITFPAYLEWRPPIILKKYVLLSLLPSNAKMIEEIVKQPLQEGSWISDVQNIISPKDLLAHALVFLYLRDTLEQRIIVDSHPIQSHMFCHLHCGIPLTVVAHGIN